MIKKLVCVFGVISISAVQINSFAATAAPVKPATIVKKTSLTPLDRMVAVVNSDIITQTQLDQQLLITKNQLQSQNASIPSDAQLRKQVLQDLIDHSLQLQAARRAGLDVTPAEIDKAIDTIAKRNHFTTAQLRQALAQQGMIFPAYRKQLHDQILMSKVQQGGFGHTIVITPADINNFTKSGKNINLTANQYQLRDILVPVPGTPTPAQIDAARIKANELVKQLRAGANFQKIAIAQSGDDKALSGGDLGWRHLAELPPLFAQQVTTMKTGGISEPIHAPNGFHILKLVAVKISSQNLTQAQIHQLIYEQKMQEKVQAWLQKLRQDAYIKVIG
jgi:peptidyl-prolyl cis-trans isomerase SurA